MRSLRNKGMAAIAAVVVTVGTLALTVQLALAQSDSTSEVVAALDRIAITRLVAGVVPSQTDADSAALTAVANIPFNPTTGVTVKTNDGQTITIGLPDATHLSRGVKTASGVVVYHNPNGSDAVAVPTAQGVQFLTVIENANAPTDYAYPTATPQGGKIQLAAGGGALVLDGRGVPVSSIAAPWALGGNGAVKTWFITDGRTLTQHIAHKAAGVQYPVVADPLFYWYPEGVKILLGMNATATLAGSLIFLPVVAGLSSIGSIAIQNSLLWRAGWFQVQSAWLRTQNQCLWIWATYTGRVESGGYAC